MDDYYTVFQAAIILKVHPLTIRRYIRDGKLKAVRAGGNIRIAVSDLKDFIAGFETQAKSSFLPKIQKKPFSFDDPLFRLKAKGASLGKSDME
jgi:excisionase family DNA binding protein